MSRPTNPGVPAGGPPQPRRQPGQEHQAQQPAWPPQPPGGAAWPPPQQPQQAYAPPPPPAYAPPPQPQHAPSDPYGAAAYHYPQGQQPTDPYQQQQPPPRPAGYAPQFERFNAAPGGQTQPPPRPPMPQRAPEPPQDYHQGGYPLADDPHYAQARTEQPRTAPPRMQPQTAPPPIQRPAEPQLRGTIADQWPTAAPPRTQPPQQPQQSQQTDPRGYDLSSYDPQGGLGEPPQGQRHAIGRAGEWPGQPPLASDRRFAAPQPEPQMDLAGYAGQQPAGQPAGRAVVAEQDYVHDEAEYDEEPPRRSRGLLIVGALVGAIALGGGLAYGYKTFLGTSPAGKSPPMIKADKSPAKTQPTDPGGKQFSGQAMKVMNGRLTDGTDTSAQSASASEDGVRTVKTLAITPPGGAPQPPPAAAPPGSVAMPGVYVVDPLRRAPPQPSPQQQALMAQQQPTLPPAAQPPQAPRTITLPPPRAEAPPPAGPVTPVAKAPPRVAVAAAPPPAAPAAAAAPVVKKPAPRPAGAVAAPSGVGAGGSGYVAVLASQRSSTEALAKFADLQQKYSALQGRTPAVQEANLGEKGTYYRLVVPAGPKEQASALCTELKASGHADCWIKTQ